MFAFQRVDLANMIAFIFTLMLLLNVKIRLFIVYQGLANKNQFKVNVDLRNALRFSPNFLIESPIYITGLGLVTHSEHLLQAHVLDETS